MGYYSNAMKKLRDIRITGHNKIYVDNDALEEAKTITHNLLKEDEGERNR